MLGAATLAIEPPVTVKDDGISEVSPAAAGPPLEAEGDEAAAEPRCEKAMEVRTQGASIKDTQTAEGVETGPTEEVTRAEKDGQKEDQKESTRENHPAEKTRNPELNQSEEENEPTQKDGQNNQTTDSDHKSEPTEQATVGDKGSRGKTEVEEEDPQSTQVGDEGERPPIHRIAEHEALTDEAEPAKGGPQNDERESKERDESTERKHQDSRHAEENKRTGSIHKEINSDDRNVLDKTESQSVEDIRKDTEAATEDTQSEQETESGVKDNTEWKRAELVLKDANDEQVQTDADSEQVQTKSPVKVRSSEHRESELEDEDSRCELKKKEPAVQETETGQKAPEREVMDEMSDEKRTELEGKDTVTEQKKTELVGKDTNSEQEQTIKDAISKQNESKYAGKDAGDRQTETTLIGTEAVNEQTETELVGTDTSGQTKVPRTDTDEHEEAKRTGQITKNEQMMAKDKNEQDGTNAEHDKQKEAKANSAVETKLAWDTDIIMETTSTGKPTKYKRPGKGDTHPTEQDIRQEEEDMYSQTKTPMKSEPTEEILQSDRQTWRRKDIQTTEEAAKKLEERNRSRKLVNKATQTVKNAAHKKRKPENTGNISDNSAASSAETFTSTEFTELKTQLCRLEKMLHEMVHVTRRLTIVAKVGKH